MNSRGNIPSQGVLKKNFYAYLNNLSTYDTMQLIEKSSNAEVYRSTMYGTDEDHKYFFITNKFLYEYGVAGLLKSVFYKKNDSIEKIISRSTWGDYNLLNKSESRLDDKKIINTFINYASRIIDNFSEDSEGIIKLLRNNNLNRNIARFKDYLSLDPTNTPIPDFDEQMVPVVTVGENCYNNCNYCIIRKDNTNGIKFYSKEKIISNIKLAKEINEFHHSDILSHINEGFINIPDILLLHHSPKASMDPIEIFRIYKELIKGVQVASFVSAESINRTSSEYLRELNKAGFYAAYLGIETGHDEVSRILGKNISYDEKLEASEKIIHSGTYLKQIVQVGFGKKFKIGSKTISAEEALDKTAELVTDSRPRKLIISRYKNQKGTNMNSLYESGIIEAYDDPEKGAQYEEEYLENKIRELYRKKGKNWQGQFDNPLNNSPKIEKEYNQYLKISA